MFSIMYKLRCDDISPCLNAGIYILSALLNLADYFHKKGSNFASLV